MMLLGLQIQEGLPCLPHAHVSVLGFGISSLYHTVGGVPVGGVARDMVLLDVVTAPVHPWSTDSTLKQPIIDDMIQTHILKIPADYIL